MNDYNDTDQHPAAGGVSGKGPTDEGVSSNVPDKGASHSAVGSAPRPRDQPQATETAPNNAQPHDPAYQEKLDHLQAIERLLGGAVLPPEPPKSRIRILADTVAETIVSRNLDETPLKIASATDVSRYIGIAQSPEGSRLVVNTVNYAPGKWFQRRQWRAVEKDPEDEVVIKAAEEVLNK